MIAIRQFFTAIWHYALYLNGGGKMMVRAALIAALALPIMGGCAQDDPDNVPLRGEWEYTRTLDSVMVDGVIFSADQIPNAMREFEGTETRCGEPIYNNADWQRDDISQRTGGSCELESYSHDDAGAQYGGRCTIQQGGDTFNPKLRGSSDFDESSSRDVVTLEGTIKIPGDPSLHVLKAIAVQDGVRIGDC